MVTENLSCAFVKPLVLAYVNESGTASKREILNDMIFSESVAYYIAVVFILIKLLVSLFHPYVETIFGLVDISYVKIIHQNFR